MFLFSTDMTAQAAGARITANLAREISQSDVAKHKVSMVFRLPSQFFFSFEKSSLSLLMKHVRMLGEQLMSALREVQKEELGLEGTKMQERVHEVVA